MAKVKRRAIQRKAAKTGETVLFKIIEGLAFGLGLGLGTFMATLAAAQIKAKAGIT